MERRRLHPGRVAGTMEIVLVLDPVGSFGEKIPIMILFNRSDGERSSFSSRSTSPRLRDLH
jgi:hypothetical protein